MDQESKKLKVFQNFKEHFEKKETVELIDLSDEEVKRWLIEWFYDTRSYALEEYFTGRIVMNQMAASARKPVEETSDKYDQEWTVKGRNFFSLKEIRGRIEELEMEIFAGNQEAIDVISGAKKEALFRGMSIDQDKGDVLI
jgi:hypothetical protein